MRATLYKSVKMSVNTRRLSATAVAAAVKHCKRQGIQPDATCCNYKLYTESIAGTMYRMRKMCKRLSHSGDLYKCAGTRTKTARD